MFEFSSVGGRSDSNEVEAGLLGSAFHDRIHFAHLSS
jgi:hypothetical protein